MVLISRKKLITAIQAGYTREEAEILGGCIHDELWERGIRGCLHNLEAFAYISSRFVTTQEEWDKGKKNPKEFGKFIATAVLAKVAELGGGDNSKQAN